MMNQIIVSLVSPIFAVLTINLIKNTNTKLTFRLFFTQYIRRLVLPMTTLSYTSNDPDFVISHSRHVSLCRKGGNPILTVNLKV